MPSPSPHAARALPIPIPRAHGGHTNALKTWGPSAEADGRVCAIAVTATVHLACSAILTLLSQVTGTPSSSSTTRGYALGIHAWGWFFDVRACDVHHRLVACCRSYDARMQVCSCASSSTTTLELFLN